MNIDEADLDRYINLLDLPLTDVVQKSILPYLSWKDLFNLRLVSEQCLQLVSNYLLSLRSIDLSKENNAFNELAFKVVTYDNTLIEILILPRCTWLTDDNLLPVLKLNSNLRRINLSGCPNLTATIIEMICNRVHNLEEIDVQDCQWVNSQVVKTLSTYCQNLTSVNFTNCSLVNDEGIKVLANCCIRLKSIALANVYGITDASLEAIANHCRCLISLDVHGCWKITNTGIRMIGEYCKNLKSLQVRECRYISEVCLPNRLRKQLDIDLPEIPYPGNRKLIILLHRYVQI